MPKAQKVIFMTCASIILCSLLCNRAQSLDVANDKIPLRVAVIIDKKLSEMQLIHNSNTFWIGMITEDVAKEYVKTKYYKYDMLSSLKPNIKYDVVLYINISCEYNCNLIFYILNNQISQIVTVDESTAEEIGSVGLLYGSIESRDKIKKEAIKRVFDKAMLKLYKKIEFNEFIIATYLKRTLPEKIISSLVFSDNNSILLNKINNYDAAVIWYERAVLEGSETAEINLKNLYPKGIGPLQKTDKIVEIYRNAMFKEIPDAQYFLGNAYEKGDGIKSDVIEAIKWYRLSAKQGNQNAKHRLENLELNSIVVNKYDADQGKNLALMRLGDIYSEGRGVPQDDVEALKWYQLAEKKRFPEAKNKIELLKNTSIKLNSIAAEEGSIDSQLLLANIYEDGIRVGKNDAESKKYYSMAAKQYEITNSYDNAISIYEKINNKENIRNIAMVYLGYKNYKMSYSVFLRSGMNEKESANVIAKAAELDNNYSISAEYYDISGNIIKKNQSLNKLATEYENNGNYVSAADAYKLAGDNKKYAEMIKKEKIRIAKAKAIEAGRNKEEKIRAAKADKVAKLLGHRAARAAIGNEALSMLQYRIFRQANGSSGYMDYAISRANSFEDSDGARFLMSALCDGAYLDGTQRLIQANILGVRPMDFDSPTVKKLCN